MISANDILQISRANPHDRWVDGDGSAAERIAKHLVVPASQQSFMARPDDKFFAIGSCFARNVEERLEQAGATVTSCNIKVRNLGNTSVREGGIFNKYSPVSILQELKWAAGLSKYPVAALLPVNDGTHYDPYLSGKAGTGSVEDLMARRDEVNAYFAQAFDADVVILTLGLIEAWTDLETGLILNEAPVPKVLTRNKARFGFERLSLEQCEAALGEIHEILITHGKQGQKIILTVSPVPVGRTFTADDIIVANATSKSTLRVAAMRLAERTEHLDYFPSYEAVMHSNPALSWQNDRLHVSDVVVGRIIQAFITRYGVNKISDAPVDEDPVELTGGSTDALLANLNTELNHYKTLFIKTKMRLHSTDQEEGISVPAGSTAMREDPEFAKWAREAFDADDLLARVYREMRKYKKKVIGLQKEQRSGMNEES